MKPSKSYLGEFRLEGKDERTDRVSKKLVEDEAAARQEKIRFLRKARFERDASVRKDDPSTPESGDEDRD